MIFDGGDYILKCYLCSCIVCGNQKKKNVKYIHRNGLHRKNGK